MDKLHCTSLVYFKLGVRWAQVEYKIGSRGMRYNVLKVMVGNRVRNKVRDRDRVKIRNRARVRNRVRDRVKVRNKIRVRGKVRD